MNENTLPNPIATAFLSCSLREEDRPFVNYVEQILQKHNIQTIGTVGYYSAAPTNTAEHMRKNIPLADFVVIVATPRYVQKDLKSGKKSHGLSEMVHVETGMAYMADKPVVVFVQEGTNVGSFLPIITQYITLNGQQIDLQNKWKLINSLISNAYNTVLDIKSKQANKSFLNILKTGLAIVGSISIFNSLSSGEEYEDDFE